MEPAQRKSPTFPPSPPVAELWARLPQNPFPQRQAVFRITSMAATFATATPNSLPLLCGKALAVGFVVTLICGAPLSGFERTAAVEDTAKLALESDHEDVPRVVPNEPGESVKTFRA